MPPETAVWGRMTTQLLNVEVLFERSVGFHFVLSDHFGISQDLASATKKLAGHLLEKVHSH